MARSVFLPALHACLFLCTPLEAQGARSDYERAQNLQRLFESKVLRARIEPRWLPGSARFWYRRELGGGREELILVDAEKGLRKAAFEAARLAGALEAATAKSFDPKELRVEAIESWDGENALRLRIGGSLWDLHLETYELRAAPEAKGEAASPIETDLRTRRTGRETSIIFSNRTSEEVEVFWIDPEGDRKPYGTVGPGEEREQHTFGGHVWLLVRKDGAALGAFETPEEGGTAVISQEGVTVRAERRGNRRGRGESPDGKWAPFFEGHNVWLRSAATGEAFQLSADGTEEDAYSGRVFWSPDSRKLVALRTKKGDERKVYYVESSPKDQLQPKLHSYDYLKPGDRIPISKPQLFHAESRKHIPIADDLFPNPWSISEIRWAPDSSRFTFLYNQRGHQVLRIVAVDAETGAAQAVIDERSATFIDYAGKYYAHYLNESGEILWMSERDGWNHLYLFDAATGSLKNQVTRGEWVVRRVDRADEARRRVHFWAGGIRPGQDPYYLHYCRADFDGGGLLVLTEGDGTHAVRFSPDRRYFLDTWSRVDLPPIHELRRAEDGALISELERADISALLEAGWKPPIRFAAKGRDGETDIYGVIFRPTNFDPSKKYPVIEEIYAGPQDSYVPKAFRPYFPAQSLAELGFVVVKIDGMGTSNRSKRFHDVAWKNLADSGFPDRIAWMRAAAQAYPWMDIERVGIYGGSAGGQSAMRALLAHGDFYKVAVADCGCHDNRMDKIWWNELWMGWPVGPHYEEQSNVTQAHRLQGKLLLIVGEMDENVDPASTLQVVAALIRADKDFDMLLVPGVGHGAAETPYARRRRAEFFLRHLLGGHP